MKYMHPLLLAAATALSSPAFAQDTLYFAGYSGDFQTMFEKEIAPAFETKQNVKIVYVPGNSSETIAKLQAQKGNQEINVAMVDDGPMHQAINFGFCDKVSDAPVYNDIYDLANTATFEGRAIGLGLVATGIAYNKQAFDKNGWPTPTSWHDLTDAKFSQRLASNPISGTYGLSTLVMFARMNGGGETNIEPGFDAVRDRLAPNVLSWSSSNAQLAQMFQNGDIDVAVWGSGRTVALKKTGFPVEFVYPKEGAPAIAISACAVSGSKLPEKSQALLQYLASPEVQANLASQGYGPTNRKTKLEGPLAEEVPYGEEELSKLIVLDWETINQKRADWTKEWTRTVEK
ncbi:ABC transporter substrate-binding protein [Rhizobium sp. M1]|uniref:ABC transporter substrate-binding protein n=1 Tax=Rhizobium sp. M1 TaxID=2035453 RepID=UPI000BE83FD0|nr:ABC transporter substrate-binding protein [Rhizobium sp. M1]PDT10849.1 branched-chain amino acid ABC transporter substrate-binding protein [Rhizobium sp. M1]